MSITIELSPEQEAAWRAQAQAKGQSVEQWLVRLAEKAAEPESIAHLQKTDPEEWARRFREWADGHHYNLPILSDEDISRESIY